MEFIIECLKEGVPCESANRIRLTAPGNLVQVDLDLAGKTGKN
jgi:molybdenum cofactor biosynthesis enzyme MoaA